MENKNSKMPIIIVCLISVVLIGVTGVVAYNMGKANTKDDSNEVVNNTQDNKTEVDITNKALKEEYYEKIKKVESTTLKDNNKEAKLYTIYSKDVVGIENIDVDSMYTSVFDVSDNFIEVTDKKLQDNYDEVGPLKTLYEEVNNLYGNIGNFSGKVLGCPSYEVNKQKTYIYKSYRCGYGTSPGIISVINKITELDNNIYVYMYIGSFSTDDDMIYSDPNLENKYKKGDLDSISKLREADYNNFTQFKYTFTKNNDGYYLFTKLEKITK